MKILDWIQGKKLELETLEIEERDDLVVIPSWQFALLVQNYIELKKSNVGFAMMLLLFAFVFLMLLSIR